MVPPITRSPTPLVTGIDSPVSMLSSTALLPTRISPSTGIRSPGRTITVSPASTDSNGRSRSASSRSTRAVLGCRCTSERSADEVRCLARASNMLPVRINAMISTTASKYTSGATPRLIKKSGATVATSEYRKAAPVPTATSVFMSAA